MPPIHSMAVFPHARSLMHKHKRNNNNHQRTRRKKKKHCEHRNYRLYALCRREDFDAECSAARQCFPWRFCVLFILFCCCCLLISHFIWFLLFGIYKAVLMALRMVTTNRRCRACETQKTRFISNLLAHNCICIWRGCDCCAADMRYERTGEWHEKYIIYSFRCHIICVLNLLLLARIETPCPTTAEWETESGMTVRMTIVMMMFSCENELAADRRRRKCSNCDSPLKLNREANKNGCHKKTLNNTS